MTGGAHAQTAALQKEIMLQVNQRLFESGIISKEVYEQAKVNIVART